MSITSGRKGSTCKMGQKNLFPTVFADIKVNLLPHSNKNKQNRYTDDARCNFGRNSECQLLHGIRNDGSLQNGSKKFSISLQFSRMFKSIYYPIWNSKTSKCISDDAVSRLVFLCPNQRLLLKTNEESATGLDLSIFVVVLLPTYLANFEAFFWRFL